MLLEGSNVSTVLTWVRPDLDKHLNQIRTQIEHIANSAASSVMLSKYRRTSAAVKIHLRGSDVAGRNARG